MVQFDSCLVRTIVSITDNLLFSGREGCIIWFAGWSGWLYGMAGVKNYESSGPESEQKGM
jgi:hypothetical protein